MATTTSEAAPVPSLIVGLRLSSKKAAVFGSGQAAASRAIFALDAGADVVIYGPNIPESLNKWIESGRIRLSPATSYASADIVAFSVVFVADSVGCDQQTVVQDAHAAGIPVNVAGNADLSDFVLMPTYSGSSSLQIAVTTNGIAPRAASRLLKEIVRKLPADFEPQLNEAARLGSVARTAEKEHSKILAKLDIVAANSVSVDVSTAPTAIQTPQASAPLSEAEADTQSVGPLLDLDALRNDVVQVEQVANVQVASGYISHALSDLCFVYSAPEQDIGEAPLAWSRRAEKNAHGDWVSALRMETRSGAGHALWGALSSGSKVSAIASAVSLPYMVPVISQLVSQNLPLVIHASAQSLDEFDAAQSDFADAFLALQTNAVFVASSTAQEAHDMALVAHAVAQAAKTPVVHLTNGSAESTAPVTVRMSSYSQAARYVEAVVAAAAKSDGPASHATAINQAFVEFRNVFGRTYRAFEYSGSTDAESVFVSLGQTASTLQQELPSILKQRSAGVLNVRVLRPWSADGFVDSLPASARQLTVLGSTSSMESLSDPFFAEVSASVFIGKQTPTAVQVVNKNIYGANGQAAADAAYQTLGLEVPDQTSADLQQDELPPTTSSTPDKQDDGANAAIVVDPTATYDSAIAVAQRIAFPEAFATQVVSRPGEHTFAIKVSALRRMTPSTYDRNIIHIEFDTRGTDLTYEIGDALGVYGYNDSAQVDEFCKAYGLDGSEFVTAVKDGQCQTRSVHSWLAHALDLFGRPSKKFYSALADFATNTDEAEKLRWLTTGDGSIEFKDRVADTVTYADLLLEFASAHPSILHLVDLIAPIKPRHYSIASSARMHPGSVHLCVVTVEWKDSKGQLRTGQCTRFLNSLSIGDEVVVSVKPSVMKLPPLDSQPVIMAGLGTGMAPFRAFIEERAVRKLEGADVGPMTLYFGSRHRAMEYLYGEEFEAYHADGLLTNLRLAFSRDQKNKVYIQHRMREDSEMLSSQILSEDGSFYLCGPTWPTGDVKDAMVAAFTEFGSIRPSEANKVIEELKEKERYILEVY
ncbi:sulfite reductase [NADPH] flavoprotein component [Coemansia sp. Benny D160-2]|nr:sulfite reductase [NADPH] flavoprotein component [Coemansia sp. Benny D160-2]